MATLTFNGESFTVDHAVKGSDYIHGYDANGICVVAFEDVSDLSAISYSGTYMAPGDCATEVCNKVVYCGGVLKTLGGAEVATYSPLAEKTADYSIVSGDLGKTLYTSGTDEITITLSTATAAAMALGSEIAILRGAEGEAKIMFTDTGLAVGVAGEGQIRSATATESVVVKIPEVYGMIALKKLFSDTWVITGNVEVSA